MKLPNLKLETGEFSVCRLDASSPLPAWATQSDFFSVTRTADELSIVCMQASVPENIKSDAGWKLIQVIGPLEFHLTGILASIAQPLADAEVSIFAISTFDTDFLLIKADRLTLAVATLQAAGFVFV